MTIAFHRGGLPEAHFPQEDKSGSEAPVRWGLNDDGEVTQAYRVELARAAERQGYDSILSIMTDRNYDPFVATSFLAAHTSKIKYIVALRPGTVHPTWAARQVQTFQEMSGDRLYLNIITGSHERELRALGETLEKSERYARTSEFFDVLKLCLTGQPFDYNGKYYSIEQGGLPRPVAVPPKLFIGGSSPEGVAVAGKHAEIHLSYSETPPLIAETIARVREQAAKNGRTIEFGILISAIARETSKAAWAETDKILDNLDIEQVQRRRMVATTRNSVGEARVQSLSKGTDLRDRASLRIYPNIWAGPHRTTLVGSYAEVAERIEEYAAAGVKHFVIQGRPTMRSIIEFGEGVIPYFARSAAPRDLKNSSQESEQAFGELRASRK